MVRLLMDPSITERNEDHLRWRGAPLTDTLIGTVDRPRRGRPVAAADYGTLASWLGVDVPALVALAQVESGGRAFGADGRPILRFEQHVFRRETQKTYDRTHPHLSAPYEVSQRFQRNQGQEWRWFEEAFALDPVAAIRSASWGRFQIMGFHHEALGFHDAQSFRAAMEAGEREQLAIFGNFLVSQPGLVDALRKLDWAEVARIYNGQRYRDWGYDKKLKRAYEQLRRSEGPPPLP